MPKSTQLLLAHRGFSAIAPENTKLAFDLAYEFCFDGVELDVHLSKDKRLVVIHDENTKRTSLRSKEISDSTFHELEQEDVAAFFKVKTRVQKILSLEEFLDLYLEKFSVINIEIKTDQKKYKGIEGLIHKLVSKYDSKLVEKIIFSSFNFESLQKIYDLNPNYNLGFLFWTKTQLTKVEKERIVKICKYLHPWTKMYLKEAKLINSFKLPLNLWTSSPNEFELFKNDKKVYSQISNFKLEA
ncbi:glycerophosphodiester phosphodiesterase family protein [Mesomycoplasma hyorhinis]|uniref:glycerophosphodiester phosphodiesterase family protein n=1 Tax=Mesomycoplasma hyorhinis TaxID=2100 RepID=UPI001C0591BF|nr:glycerophosphodiester phosphodiesterase family protein [Mesomycoplasma hyorhinis]